MFLSGIQSIKLKRQLLVGVINKRPKAVDTYQTIFKISAAESSKLSTRLR